MYVKLMQLKLTQIKGKFASQWGKQEDLVDLWTLYRHIWDDNRY